MCVLFTHSVFVFAALAENLDVNMVSGASVVASLS